MGEDEEFKKSKQKRKREKKEKAVAVEAESPSNEHDTDKSKRARRDERKKLMEKVPKVDEHGIAYTKQQLRRMRKRVERGLHPIESEAERQERLHRQAELKREEEAELTGMVYQKGNEGENEPDKQLDQDSDQESQIDDGNNEQDAKQSAEAMPFQSQTEKPKKKSRRSKPVPSDYVCLACQNKHAPPHWIYDCPDKVTVRGANQVAKKLKGIHNPDARKVFVSGLPFEVRAKDIEKMFASCGKVVHCKLLKFEDTGRCKGQAILAFETDEGARKALTLSGTVIDNEVPSPKKKEQKDSAATKRKELKLKVTKVLNRTVTKKNRKV